MACCCLAGSGILGGVVGGRQIAGDLGGPQLPHWGCRGWLGRDGSCGTYTYKYNSLDYARRSNIDDLNVTISLVEMYIKKRQQQFFKSVNELRIAE